MIKSLARQWRAAKPSNSMLASPDISSLSNSLSRWETAEYVYAGLVALACAGEYVADFTTWFTAGREERRKQLAKISTLVLIASLALELVCLVKTNSLSGLLIGSLSERAERADQKARTAITDSSTALSQARDAQARAGAAQDSLGRAQDEANKAQDEANKAQSAATSALTLARGAREEADSFERDIVSAKKQAADAESHLAEALKRAAVTSAELDRIKSPRSLTDVSGLVDILRPFGGTEFKFESVFADDESIHLLRQINAALESAGWKRIKQSGMNLSIPTVQLGQNDLVNTDVSTGTLVIVESTEPMEALESLPRDKLPSNVRIAIILNEAIISHMSPPESLTPQNRVSVSPGSSTVIRIKVGKKP
jgi:hypothetical protein